MPTHYFRKKLNLMTQLKNDAEENIITNRKSIEKYDEEIKNLRILELRWEKKLRHLAILETYFGPEVFEVDLELSDANILENILKLLKEVVNDKVQSGDFVISRIKGKFPHRIKAILGNDNDLTKYF